eukprot:3715331-Amphidinium_carterae.1
MSLRWWGSGLGGVIGEGLAGQRRIAYPQFDSALQMCAQKKGVSAEDRIADGAGNDLNPLPLPRATA